MLEAKTSQEHHGQGVLVFCDGQPVSASGCLLPDGTPTDVDCLLCRNGGQVWTRPLGPDPRVRRRGRLVVDPGIALRFIDEPSADIPSPNNRKPSRDNSKPSLERDLIASDHIRSCVECDLFADLLFSTLGYVTWRHKASDETWSCGWRQAGELVARLGADGDDVCWNLSLGREGTTDEAVLMETEALGWEPRAVGQPIRRDEAV